jgi:hypothetical protein
VNSSSTVVNSSANPSAFGQSVTFTATVSGSGGIPTGTVTLKDGASTLGSGALNGSGQATFATSTLTAGAHSITAVYSGDSDFSGSTSPVLTQNVTVNSSSTSVSSSVNPSASGQSVTFTATVSGAGGTPTGAVTFKDGATTLGTATVSGGGQATLSTGSLSIGSHSITAAYGGDLNYSGSTSPVLAQNVTANSSSTAVTSSSNPSVFGQSVTFTATVSGSGGTPTGTVSFKDGATTLGSGTLNGSGQVTFATSTLTAGSHSITAVYGGDTNFSSSTSPVLTQSVTTTSSSVAIGSSADPSTFGQSVTFTATVTGSGGTPAGTVTFKDGATTLGAGTVNGTGQATFSTSSLTVGGHSITAVYGGDSNYAGSTSAVLTQSVIVTSSSVAISSSVNPSTFGQSVTFTATVTGSGGTPTGTVTFRDGATTLGSGMLNGSGQAAFATSVLTAGTHSITAVYSGDSNFAGNTSAVLTQSIAANSSSTSVTSSVNPSAFGQAVTFTATVSGAGGTPTGTVTFKDGATTLGSGTLNGSGQASFATSSLAAGGHSITATYSGDSNFGNSVSSVLTQTVNQNSSGTSVTSSANPSIYGSPVTFTATVTGTGGTPTGTVTFKDGGTALGSATLNGSGQAALSTSSLSTGAHSITAVYSGDSNFSSNTSPVLTQNVAVNSSSTAVTSSANPSAFGQAVTFTATVNGAGGTPTGTITFKDGATTLGSGTLNGSGQATFAASALTAGAHSITALYGGDSNFSNSTSPVLTQSVGQTAAGTSLSSSANPSSYNTPVTFTAIVTGTGGTPTGTVTFKDGATALGTATINGSGQAALTMSSLTAGSHPITATYSGDANFSSSTSPTLTQNVSSNAASVSLTSSVNPSKFGQPVNFVAAVTGSGGTPTGSITFKDGSNVLGTISLAAGSATLTTSSLAVGSHSITAVYSGDASFMATTSAALSQSVSVPADSVKLRDMQIAGTKVAAQVSGDAIAGSIDSAVSDGFTDDCSPLTPNATGVRLNVCPERNNNNGRVDSAFNALKDMGPKWLAWTDLRGTELNTNPATGNITGRQVNALTGFTYRFAPTFLVGAFGGYEYFNYSSESLTGRLQGDGWTVGAYFGWRFLPGLRFEAGFAQSGVNFYGVAGTAVGSFPGTRSLATAGLTGNYKITSGFEMEPSANFYALWEREGSYTDSLGTAQGERTFSTGRASVGAKFTYRWPISDRVTIAPYGGFYVDYYFEKDDASAAALPLPESVMDGLSGRIISGVALTTLSGAQFAVGGEIGGVGSDNFTTWTVRARAAVPF